MLWYLPLISELFRRPQSKAYAPSFLFAYIFTQSVVGPFRSSIAVVMLNRQTGFSSVRINVSSLIATPDTSHLTMINSCRNIIAGCVWLISTAHAQAHDFWVEPVSFTPKENQAVAISLRFGVGFKGDTLPYNNGSFNDFSLTSQSGRVDIHSRQGSNPAAIIGATAGAQLLGYQSMPQFIELDAEKFNEYVEEEGIEYIRAVRERRGESNSSAPEIFIRCAKALIQTGLANREIYREKLGYTLELIPQSDPYQLKKGDELEFELLYLGKPFEGLLLQALSKADPENVQKVRTDKNGRAHVAINEPGVWLIKVVLIMPIKGRQQANKGVPSAVWQSYWASYVFELVES